MVNHGELFLRISWDTTPTAAPASTRTGITEISDHGGLHFLPVKMVIFQFSTFNHQRVAG